MVIRVYKAKLTDVWARLQHKGAKKRMKKKMVIWYGSIQYARRKGWRWQIVAHCCNVLCRSKWSPTLDTFWQYCTNGHICWSHGEKGEIKLL